MRSILPLGPMLIRSKPFCEPPIAMLRGAHFVKLMGQNRSDLSAGAVIASEVVVRGTCVDEAHFKFNIWHGRSSHRGPLVKYHRLRITLEEFLSSSMR